MRALVPAFLLTLATLGCGSAPPAAPATNSAAKPAASSATDPGSKQLAADTAMKTPTGAVFEAPKGWWVADRGDVIVLQNPEKDLVLALVEVTSAKDGEDAIGGAWKRTVPAFARKVRQTAHPPPKDGWDDITQVVYETGGAEQRMVTGLSLKKGAVHYVALIDGTEAGIDRRGAQLMTVMSTFKAPGVKEESFAGKSANPLDEARAKKLDAFIADAMKQSTVPGAAIVIVQGGKIVFEKAYGVRELGKADAVTPSTLFMIGSTTKSLTTLMMAKLVDEGKFGWDTPLTRIAPSFALADAEVTKQVLLRHTVCACAGLPRQDMEFLFEYGSSTPEQRVESMRTMKPTTGFGETFQYSNTMVAAGGYLAAQAADKRKKLGPAYDEAMQSRVFAPLGMTSTTLDFAVAKGRDHAIPHGENYKGDTLAMPLGVEEGVVSVRPAGAAWSNVRDMSKYLMLELAKGKDASGKEVVSEKNLLERRKPSIKITDKISYGLGLFVEEDHGLHVVHHGGNNLGFTSDMYIFPDHGVGVVMLMNAGSANTFRRVVHRRVVELLFDGREEAAKTLAFSLEKKKDVLEQELGKITAQPDAAWLDSVKGTYKSPSLGVIKLASEGAKGVLDAGEWRSTFGRLRASDGTIKVVLLDPPLAGLELMPANQGGKKTLSLDAPQQKYGFELVAE